VEKPERARVGSEHIPHDATGDRRGFPMTDPCTPLEERAAIIAEACGVSQAEGLRMAKWQEQERRQTDGRLLHVGQPDSTRIHLPER
jgi:hypothetical protein